LVALAYALDDAGLQAKAQRWIEAILAGQDEEGMFGPRSNRDWWSRMPVLMALRDYYEATELRGRPDGRILPFLTKYFEYQYKTMPTLPLQSWARARGGDNLDSVYWLFARLHDPAQPEKTEWLLELAQIIRSQTQDWPTIMNETTVREHVVNTSQAMKMPPLYWQQSGNEYDRAAFANALLHFGVDHGRLDGLPNSDEAARDNRSTRGSELCGIVEGMLSSGSRIEVLSAITELRQICGHPSLVLPDYAASSGKLDLLLDILPGALEAGHRALIFSQFTRMLRILQRRLEAAGVQCLYLDGDTPPKRRIELVEEFNSGTGQVFLISLKAGGSGLNLTGADTVIHFDPWWNPAAEDQATDRAHRIGQKNTVNVIRLITRGTIEEQVVKLGQRKRELFDQMITAGEQMPTKLSQEDIRALFE
jgi:hypothetical protein